MVDAQFDLVRKVRSPLADYTLGRFAFTLFLRPRDLGLVPLRLRFVERCGKNVSRPGPIVRPPPTPTVIH